MRLGFVTVAVLLVGCAAGELQHDARLDFEDVAVGSSRTMSVVLRNVGGAPLNVLLSVDDARFVLSAPQVSVPPRASTTVEVTFTPDALSVLERELLVQTSSGPSTTVSLRGRGFGASVEAAEEVQLGHIRLVRGEPPPSIPVPLRVRNDGTSRSELALTVRSNAAELCVGDDCAGWSAVVPAGAVLNVPLVLEPVLEGPRAWTLTLTSNDALRPTRTVIVRAVVQRFEPCDLTVTSPVVVPVNGAGKLELTHVGVGRCLVRSITLTSTPDAMRFDTEPVLPLELETGRPVTYWLKTTQPRPLQGAGVVAIEAGGAARLEVPVSLAQLDVSCLVVAPSTVDVGAVPLGCAATRTVQVYNTCSFALRIDSLRVGAGAGEQPGGPNCSGPLPCPEFHLVSGVNDGTVLAPAGVTSFQVRYQPINFGSDTGAFVFSVSGAELVFSVQGRGDSPGTVVDTFRDEPLPVVDWLMMVDTSPSFTSRLADVRDNVRRLLSTPRLQCVDLRVAFAPAEGDAGVSFALNDAGAAWTSTLEADFLDRALGAFDALPASSEHEACIGPAAQLAQGQRRDGGSLHGFCVSDALEQSVNPTAALPSFSSWSAIVATAESSCAVESIDDGVHQSLVQTSHGALADICDPLWGEALIGIGGFPCGARSSFHLTAQPRAVASLEVRANGQPLPVADWFYDAAMNAVTFQPGALPPRGTTITVTYDVSCSP